MQRGGNGIYRVWYYPQFQASTGAGTYPPWRKGGGEDYGTLYIIVYIISEALISMARVFLTEQD